MNQVEKWMDEYLEHKEEEAWNLYKKQVNFDKFQFPNELVKGFKEAFLIGYGMGSVDGAEEMKRISEVDPVAFYNWLKSKE